MSTAIELLAEVPFFAPMDEEERSTLASNLDLVKYSAGEMIFQYGEPGGALYIIRSGEVEVFIKDNTGNRLILETSGPGDYFGELSLMDEGPRTASVVVTKDVDLLRLDRADLEVFFNKHPAAAMDMLAVMGKRIRQNVD